MTEPVAKVQRLAYVRVGAPDFGQAERFLERFGLQVQYRSAERVYYRGTDPEPPCYVLGEGRGGVEAIAFEAASYEDLETLSRLEGASPVEASGDPAGGYLVRLVDPAGMTVEVVWGQDSGEALDPALPHAFNMDGQRAREGELPRIEQGASRVKRLGHLVLESADPAGLFDWYHKYFGLIISDAVRLPDQSPQMIFARLDRSETYVDHHVIGFQWALDERTRVQHVAFEVSNLDDLMSGHDHLKGGAYKHVWGIGRHLLGGQIFDYWKSPFGLIHEHWTDTDLLNNKHQAQDCQLADMKDYWGPEPTPAFLIARWNFKVVKNLFRLLKARSMAKKA